MWGKVLAREVLVLISCSSGRDEALLGGGTGYTFRRAQKLVRGVEELDRGSHGLMNDISAVVGKTGGRLLASDTSFP